MLPKPVPSSADGPPPVRLLVAVEEFDLDLMHDFSRKCAALANHLAEVGAGQPVIQLARGLTSAAVLAHAATDVAIELRAVTLNCFCQALYELVDEAGHQAMEMAGRIEAARLELFGLPGGTSFVEAYFHG